MDMTHTHLLLGKVLGEIYRLQNACLPSGSGKDPAHVFGLLKGIETTIDEELEVMSCISNKQLDVLIKVLEKAQNDPDFKGYYSIEPELKGANIERETAIVMLKFLNARGSFTDVIDKMNSSHSPIECKDFALKDWDK